ncbi:MAG: hypothetical protein R3D62_13560 [Xanthobacteraceae bacterium]
MAFFQSVGGGHRTPRGFSDLLLVQNWTGSVLIVLASLAISFLLFGFFWPYWRIFDMDLFMVYEAFLANSALPQEYFDHPGHLTIVALGWWLHLLHDLGALKVHALAALPRPADAAGAWTEAVRAGRVLSLIIATVFAGTFAILLRRLVGDWRVAALGVFALVFSGGFIDQSRIIRTELIAAACVTIALLILLIAAGRPRTAWRPVLVGLSACLATLGMCNKVQVIFLICALPLIVLPFGEKADSPDAFWRASRYALPAALVIFVCAALAAYVASPLVWLGLTSADTSIAPWRPFAFGTFGSYQPLIAAWFILGMIGFAWTWRCPPLETLAAMAAVVGGIAIGLLSLFLHYHPQNVLVVLNPLEQLFFFATWTDPELAQRAAPMSGRLIASLLEGFAGVLARFTFVLHSTARPTIFLGWVVIAGIIIALRQGERKLALQAAVLMVAAIGFDAISTLRGLKTGYFILTDPLIVIAAALLLARLTPLRTHRWTFRIGVLLILAHIVISHTEQVKHTFQHDRPLDFCTPHFHYTKRVERFSFCPAPSG